MFREEGCPVGYFFQIKISSVTQAELIKSALVVSHNVGLKVWGIICDGAYTNFATMKILGCQFYKKDSYNDIKCWIDHPVSKEKVFYVPGACHMLKLAKNSFGNAMIIISNEGSIKWEYIKHLYEIQTSLTLKLTNKLSQSHIMWHQNKMKVKLAAQTLSTSTADALLFLKNIHIEGFHNVDATITFCRAIDRIFDFLNSRNPFAKGLKLAIYPSNIKYLESVIIPIVDYLFTFNIKNKDGTISPLYLNKKKSFCSGH